MKKEYNMCGILGYFSNNIPIDIALFYKANSLIKHRGPDDEGYISVENKRFTHFRGDDSNYKFDNFKHILKLKSTKFIFGHRRLSIIDLSSHGHQPMEYNNLAITYNGEIYNYLELKDELKSLGYIFETNTDTEVFLKAYDCWQEEAFNKFNGMWSAAIYNKRDKSIVLTRDRFGIKPLYYYFGNGRLIFSSEIKSLLCILNSVTFNKESLLDYLKYMLLDYNERTFFEEVKQLEPSYYIKIHNDVISKKKYWDLSFNYNNDNYIESKNIIFNLFKNSVELRLRSDVNIGTLLSGGIDSSAIVSLIKNQSLTDKIEAFSAVFEDDKLSEHKYVKYNEEFLNLKVNYITPTIEDFEKDFSDFIYTNEFPVKSFAVYAQYKIYKNVSEKFNVKVLLNGQGADEIFSGYNAHKFFYLASLLQRFKMIEYMSELKILKEEYNVGSKLAISSSMKILIRTYFNNFLRNKNIYHNIFLDRDDKYNEFAYVNKYGDIFKDKLFYDLTISSLREYLRYDDRNSMRFSLESRLPFLDYRLVNYLFNLPNNYKFNRGRTKNILRDSMKGIVSPNILSRKDKMGFTTPQENWQKTSMKPLFDETFNDIRVNGLFDFIDEKEVFKIYNDYINDKNRDSGFIWRIFYLYHWKKIWKGQLEK